MHSEKHPEARLDGYEGPFFPDTINGMQTELGRGNFSGSWLKEVGATIDGFVGIERPTTSDSYTWFWALIIRRGSGVIAVLVPWSQGRGGSRAERSIAVHTRGGVDIVEADAVVRELTEAVGRQRKRDKTV